MKKDTANHFKPDGAGTDLLEKLNTLNSGLTNERKLRITLLNHASSRVKER